VALNQWLVHHETDLKPTTSTLRVRVRVFDETQKLEATEPGFQDYREIDIAVQPGGALEAKLKDIDDFIIAQLNARYPNRVFTRPTL
jgi:hypothetical protein